MKRIKNINWYDYLNLMVEDNKKIIPYKFKLSDYTNIDLIRLVQYKNKTKIAGWRIKRKIPYNYKNRSSY